jgi:hypothetical protein
MAERDDAGKGTECERSSSSIVDAKNKNFLEKTVKLD